MKQITDQNTTVFMKAYRSFLSAEGKMHIDQIEKLYKEMRPSLHRKAHSAEIDMEAFLYSFLRLPQCMDRVKYIVMAQTDSIFRKSHDHIEQWEEVAAPARRRKMYFDGKDTLAVFINSVTDLDDMICLLTAFQIEWNKMHTVLEEKLSENTSYQQKLQIDDENWARIQRVWTNKSDHWLKRIESQATSFQVTLLRGSYVDYKKAAQRWFENIVENTRYKDLRTRPLYFVSSNTHSLVNNSTGWVVKQEEELISYVKTNEDKRLLDYWQRIEKGEFPGSRENFLWYILKKYEKDNPEIKQKRKDYERGMGIDFIEAKHYLDINAQVLSVKELIKSSLPEKLQKDLAMLHNSDALILNIDYPLGAGAYMVLSTILQNVNNVQGVYILGKASFLHATIGDIALPNTIFDTFSHNTYLFSNAFTREDVQDFRSGSILTNQKVVSTKGTLLHPPEVVEEYFKNDFTIVEMENGPYLNAVYEMTHYNRYPKEETISLLNTPLDIGIIHYASDTPFTKAVTLGTRNLGYEGVEATYISSLAILKRIVEQECKRS